MKNSNYKKVLIILCLLLTSCISTPAIAQFPTFFQDYVDDDGSGAPTAPIDGFLGIALAVGAYFGVRKLRKKDR